MISLKESLLNEVRKTTETIDPKTEQEIIKFIDDTYDCGEKSISDHIAFRMERGKILVDISRDARTMGYREGYIGGIFLRVRNQGIDSLTNGLFEFGNVSHGFNCSGCRLLKSLEGAPKKTGGDFNCYMCLKIKTLEGAPEEVGGNFICYTCESLISLKGGPKEVEGDFRCYNCKKLKNLKDAPKKLGGTFYCDPAAEKQVPKPLAKQVKTTH